MEPNQNGVKTWQWIVTAIVVIVLIVLGIMMLGSGKDDATNQALPEVKDVTTTEVNNLVVADQFPGNIVYVNTVQLSKPGFVVIQKDSSGQPGNIIGSQYFDKTTGVPGKINLTESTVNGKTYYATLVNDTNASKKFEVNSDVTVKDSKGSVIMKTFRARTDLPEDKG